MQLLIVGAMGMAVVIAGSTSVQTSSTPLPPKARYVAMGSSYAAGPGIPDPVDANTRCARSTNNYAHQFARKRGLTLIDVSCSGATTNDILIASSDTPAQIDAITPETSLVTVTIGGNDVGFVTLLGSASCRQLGIGKQLLGGKCPKPPKLTEHTWRNLAVSMERIAAEVRVRAPRARLVFIDYPIVLPSSGRCAATPMSTGKADAARNIANRLAVATAAAARSSGATLVRASSLSSGHDACSATPWINGFPLPGQPRFVPYHPNLDGMAAVARALDATITQIRS
jgi:lysophospholipase L1-like esterase